MIQVGKILNLNPAKIVQRVQTATFCSTRISLGRKGRKPYDVRNTMTLLGTDVGAHKPGGTREMAKEIGRRDDMPQPTGVYDKFGIFHFVPEMVPEFVVPDLKDFKLKPYVSYRAEDVTQTEFTAKDLFDATYEPPIMKKLNDDKLNINNITAEELLKDS